MKHARLRNRLVFAVPRALALVLAAGAAAQDAGDTGGEAAPPTPVLMDNVIVLLDSSGSMKEQMRRGGRAKMEVAKEALSRVLGEIPDSTNVGLLVFGGGSRMESRWLYPLSPIDRPALEAAIRKPQPKGGTPLGEFMKIASDALLEQRRKQYGYGSYRLLVVTDGEATDRSLVERYVPDILSRGITVDVIGVDMAASHTLATRVHSYRSADDPDSLVRAVADVFGEVGLSGDDATSDEQFALIAAIPDGMALSMIQALARSGNHPIGERPTAGRRSRAASPREAPDASGGAAPIGAPPGGAPPAAAPKSSSVFTFAIIVMTVVVAAIILKTVIKAARTGGGMS